MDTKALVEQAKTDAYLMLYEIRRKSHMYEDGIPVLSDFVVPTRPEPYYVCQRCPEICSRYPFENYPRHVVERDCISGMLAS